MFKHRKLQNKINELALELAVKNSEIIGLKSTISKLERELKETHQSNGRLLDSSTNLINWVRKILQTFGTTELKNKYETITIPIYRERVTRGYDGDWSCPADTEVIIIPELKLYSQGGQHF